MLDATRQSAQKKKFWIWALVAAVVVGFFTMLALTAPKVEVPDVSGKPAEEAIAVLFEKGLEYELESSSGDQIDDPAGWEVVSTNPVAGSEVSEHAEVGLLVREIPKEEVEAPSEAAVQVTVPDLIGKPGDEANDQLKGLNLATDFTSPEGWVVMKSNWDVVSMDPVPGSVVDEGTMITVTVKSALERLQQESDASDAQYEKRAAEAATLPIEEDYAMTFCDNYTEKEYPYGYSNHWILDKLAAEPRAEGGWYFKVGTTLTNAYGAEADMTLECHVSGTNGSPVMDQFLVY